ncbi:monooxygenase [Jatrophihabitans sp. YIM 134969]
MLASPTFTRRTSSGPVSFARLLGTGDSRFTPGAADLTRWVVLTVWTSAPQPVTPPWARRAVDHWGARLAPIASRGHWAGRAPFVPSGARDWSGEVLALTRARLRARRATTFWRSVPPVASSVAGADGLQASMGIGEAPVGYQGTLSLWRDRAAVAAYAWRDPAHRAVVDRTPGEDWYAEELFARFAVVERTGSLALWADSRSAA